MTLRALSLLALSSSLVAQIYSNGPLQTGIDPISGNAISVLDNVAPPAGLGHTVFGYGAQHAAGNNLGDDFAVCNGPWIIDGIEVFGYLTGGLVPSATAVHLEIYSGGLPGAGGVPLVDANGFSLPGMPVNLVTLPAATATTVGVTAYSNTMTNIYRTLPAVVLTRNIQSMRVTLSPPLIVPSGQYFLRFGFTGVNFTPPLTTRTMAVTGDGRQATTAIPAFTVVVSGPVATPHPQGLPFRLYGISAGPNGSITNLGGNCTTATFAVGGSPAAGGYVSATLGNLNPAYLPLIVTDTANPGAGTPGFLFGLPCVPCNLWFTGSFVPWFQSSLQFQLPMNPGLCGADLWIQGAQVDLFVLTAPCTIVPGIQAEFTDGHRVHLY